MGPHTQHVTVESNMIYGNVILNFKHNILVVSHYTIQQQL